MQTVPFSATILTGWSVNWIVWKLPQVSDTTNSVSLHIGNQCFYCSCCISMTGILEVLYCVLIESPEVLNIIQENHIKSIISLLDKHGRNHKVSGLKQYFKDSEHRLFTLLSAFIFRSWMCSALCASVTVLLSDPIRISSQRICFLVEISCFRPTLSITQPGKSVAESTFSLYFMLTLSKHFVLFCDCASA